MTHERPTRAPDRGVSPVVGVALLTMIVVALAFVTGAMVLDLADQPERHSLVGSTAETEVEVTADGVNNRFVLNHISGEDLPVDQVTVVVNTDAGSARLPLADVTDSDVDEWAPGDALRLDVDESVLCAGDGDEVELSVVYDGSDVASTVTRERVPIAREGFLIEDGAVRPVTDYDAEVSLVATSYKFYNAWGNPVADAPIHNEIAIGGENYDPFPGNVNNGGNPRVHAFTDVEADSEIAVEMVGVPSGQTPGGAHPDLPNEVNSTEQTERVWVLRDGDPIPDVDGYGDQDDVASHLDAYVDADAGEITLDSNEAIYLFELGTGDEDDWDYNDAVVVVSLTTTEETIVVGEDGKHVVCDADE